MLRDSNLEQPIPTVDTASKIPAKTKGIIKKKQKTERLIKANHLAFDVHLQTLWNMF